MMSRFEENFSLALFILIKRIFKGTCMLWQTKKQEWIKLVMGRGWLVTFLVSAWS